MNNYYVGDNLRLMSDLINKEIKVQMVYFDPPYNTGRDFHHFNDKFESNIHYRENFIKPRLEMIYNLLHDNGVVVVHVDPTISHHIRLVMDDVFGEKNFRNEIVWKSGGNKKSSKKLARFHDTIIVYSKTSKYIYNPQYIPYDDDYRKNMSLKKDSLGEYTTSAAHNSQPDVIPRPNLRYEWNGHLKQWWWSQDKMRELESQNRLVYNKNGVPRVKKYLHEMMGIPIRDLWTDINQIQNGEKVNYATQKPVKLLERIVKMFSNESDLIMDPFAGSGSLGRACINLNRKYILIDVNPEGKTVFEKSIE